MTGVRAAALADDTTGALEIGAHFAAARIRSRVVLEPARDSAAAAVTGEVIDTGTRHLTPGEAAAVVERCARRLRRNGAVAFFKKTDSTLRGNISREFAALLEALPARPLVYVPAYPKLGRTVKDGVLLVDGVPVAETAFGRDSRHPVRESSVVEMLRKDSSLRVKHAADPDALREMLAPESCVIVCDSCTGDDLERMATVLRSYRGELLLGGPGGFAPYWIGNLGLPVAGDWPRPEASSGLVVCGSRHPRSREQAARAVAAGLPVLPAMAPWTVAATADASDGAEEEVSSRIAAVVCEHLRHQPVDALVIFGGDTARAVLRELEVTAVEPIGELLPGIPVSVIHAGGRRTILVTKAGGFGDVGVVEQIIESLRR